MKGLQKGNYCLKFQKISEKLAKLAKRKAMQSNHNMILIKSCVVPNCRT